MPMKKKIIRLTLLVAVNFIAAYLSLKFLGGFLIFGIGRTFSEFLLIGVPVLALPIALIAWWNVRFALFLWGVAMLLFFGTQIGLAWPELKLLSHNGTHFLVFLAAGILLAGVVIFDSLEQNASAQQEL